MGVDKRKSRSADGLLEAAAGGGTLDVTLRGAHARLEFPEGITVRSVLADNGGQLSIELEVWGDLRKQLGIDTAPLHLAAAELLSFGDSLPELCRLFIEHGVTSPGIVKQSKR